MTTLLALIAALLSPPTSQPTADLAHPKPFEMGKAVKAHAGAPFTVKEQTTLDAIFAAPKTFADKQVKVAGKVKTVCAKKGCWMVLAGTAASARARVVFKDYGFFAPRDSKGAMAMVEGKIEVKTLSEAERKHLADDAKASIDTIPVTELRIIATAIEIQRVGH